MHITYKFLGNGREEISFGSAGSMIRTKANAWKRDANSFTNTVEAELFAKVVAFVGGGDHEETVFQNLKTFAAGYRPEGLSAKSTKAKRAQQKINVAALAALAN